MLDKFRRTGPATPGLESLLLFDSLVLESLLVAVALGGSAGNEEKSGPACPFPPVPSLVSRAQTCVPTLPWCCLPGSPSGFPPPTLAPRGPFPTTHLGAGGSTVRSLAWSWSASTHTGIEQTRVKSQPAPYQWRDLGQVLGLPENSACLVPKVQGY